MSVLAIDFDGVLHDTTNVRPGYKMGIPIPGAKDAMEELHHGNTIIIFTVWATSADKVKAISDWLHYFGIPYDRITAHKPAADVYLDNKAVRFSNWTQALEDIRRYK